MRHGALRPGRACGSFVSAVTAATGHGGGASVFDPVLAELIYRWFCPPGGSVLDPFAGGATRGVVASRLGLRYAGIDLRPQQVRSNRRPARSLAGRTAPRWIIGDARDVRHLAPGRYDLIFTCPPYADLEVYSDDPRDLSRMRYPSFLAALGFVLSESVSLLRPNRFAVIVVGEVRAADGTLRGLVPATIAAARDCGLGLYNDAIFLPMCGSLPLRAPTGFLTGRKLGRGHQNVLIFSKGAPTATFRGRSPLPPADLRSFLPNLTVQRDKLPNRNQTS